MVHNSAGEQLVPLPNNARLLLAPNCATIFIVGSQTGRLADNGVRLLADLTTIYSTSVATPVTLHVMLLQDLVAILPPLPKVSSM